MIIHYAYFHNLLSEWRLRECSKYLNKAMDFIKEKDRYLPSLANLYYEMGLYDSALSVIEPLLQKSPEDPQLVYLQVEFLVKNEDINKK